MRGDDAAIYREIQKNAEMGIKAIETLTPKLSDDAFALQLSRQELKYSELRDKARQEMLEGNLSGKRGIGSDAERQHTGQYTSQYQYKPYSGDYDKGRKQRLDKHVEGLEPFWECGKCEYGTGPGTHGF